MYLDVWWRYRVNGCVAASWFNNWYPIITKDTNTVLTLSCNQVPMLLQKPDSNSCYYYYHQQYKQRGAEAIECSVTATGFRLAAVKPCVESSSSVVVVNRQVSGGQNRGPWLHIANQNVNISSTTFRIFWWMGITPI